MKLAIVGPSGAGKDVAAVFLSQHTPLKYALSTSQVIAPIAAAHLGVSVAEAFRTRHENRPLWRRLGDEMRSKDPAALARETLLQGDICVGVRAIREIRAVRAYRLTDLVIWLDRDVPPDETLEFDHSEADIRISNETTLEDFHYRLKRLARALGIYAPPTPNGKPTEV